MNKGSICSMSDETSLSAVIQCVCRLFSSTFPQVRLRLHVSQGLSVTTRFVPSSVSIFLHDVKLLLSVYLFQLKSTRLAVLK